MIPNISVGGMILGESIEKYRHYHHFYFQKDPDDLYLDDYYEFVELKLTAFVGENGIINTINCNEECFLQGKNLIGSTMSECITLVGNSPDDHEQIFILIDEENGQDQDVYGFEDLGLQVWCWEDIIKTVSYTNYDLDY